MVAVAQGDVWWADLGEPVGSGPGYRRPVLIVQGDPFNRSAIATVVSAPMTSNLKWAEAPGNVLLKPKDTGLPQDSVVNVSQLVALDRNVLVERVGKVPSRKLALVLTGIDTMLGRTTA